MKTETTFNTKAALNFLSNFTSNFRFRAIMFFKIPLIWYSRIRVQQLSRGYCEVYLPFSRRTQNPFRSVYFAAQCMAAELSTGLPLMAEILEIEKKTSMLVTAMNSNFYKKADNDVIFTCDANDIIVNAIQQAIQSGEGVSFKLKSVGKMLDGTLVADFELEWSIKIKTKLST